ncbi:MAG: ABC transporter permease [Thermomicrobiales bacterium]
MTANDLQIKATRTSNPATQAAPGTASLSSVAESMERQQHRSRWQWIGTLSALHWVLLGVLAAFIVCAIFAEFIAPYDPVANDLRARLTPPAFMAGGSTDHLLGTDQLGRDMLSRIIFGARVSLAIAVIGTLAGAAFGAFCGLVAGFRRGSVDGAMMLIVDTFMALPFIVIALAVIAVVGTGFGVMVLLAALSGFAGTRELRAVGAPAFERAVRVGRQIGRRIVEPAADSPLAPEHDRSADRARHNGNGLDHPPRSIAFLSRIRHSTTDPGLGPDGQ